MFIRAIDLETTGTEPPEHAPCEVGWCDLVSTRTDLAGAPSDWHLDRQSLHNILCNPSRPIPPETSAIHHIIDEDVADAPRWPAALRAATAPIGGIFTPAAYCAHGAKFERLWITDELTGGVPFICTYKCALRLFPDAPGHGNQCLRYHLRPQGLDRAIAKETHRALPDAYVTAFLLKEMLALAPLADLIDWSSKPALLRRVPFGEHRGKLWSEIDDGLLHWTLRKDFGEDIMFSARSELERRTAEWRRQQALDGGDLFPNDYGGQR